MYFTRIGDMYTNIRGGGTDLAIIRSAIEGEKDRDRIKEIKTEVIDKRTTIIKLLDDNGNKKIIKFKSSDYDVFFRLIPEKEKSLLQDREVNIDPNINAIYKLDKLRKEGVLTEEEFSLKKGELLGKIN
ncbi:hypothetical protein FDF74_03560 [Clostridium niameyense]|uniref:SHOCT domain-containing protein n=1 Tax=Clostridium niameyense TaxID=1622073 RepID=A0A6M0RAN8_9CLOT|nr:hypothetical protein [Clostridium niameyense]NEZ46288.1 hypothetical protein [Clostridium niameyense]